MLNLTYEDVLKICQMNESFKMKTQVFGDTTVAQVTYFLASAGDFFDARGDGSMVNGTELRGIMFIKEGDGEWKRFLFLNKFFNNLIWITWHFFSFFFQNFFDLIETSFGSCIAFITIFEITFRIFFLHLKEVIIISE